MSPGLARDVGHRCGVTAVGAGEQASGHEGERGQGGQRVVLLAGGEGEEAEDEAGPEEEGESGFVVTW